MVAGIVGATVVWLGILSYFVWTQAGFLKKLFPESGGEIKDKLTEVTGVLEETGRREQVLAKNLKDQVLEGLGHVQKLAVLRYNPYNDTGGDQSFTAVFLDGRQNGLMVTSLHSRSGTRVYAKAIVKGESDLELSKEEKEALVKALA